MKSSLATRLLMFAMIVATLSIGVVAQKNASSRTLAPESVGFRLEQCANGERSTPQLANPCDTASEWITGNVNKSKAHYVEGDSVPYRMLIDGLAPGVPTYVTFSWDTSKGGIHAIDYITSYDRTENASNPNGASQALVCSGLTGAFAAICPAASVTGTSFAQIPADPNYSAATPMPAFLQDTAGQVIRMWGGTITGLGRRTSCLNDTPILDNTNPYVLCGPYSGDSTTDITVFLTPTTSNVVLAWGGHISTRANWGVGNSAASIGGSPFHTAMITGGTRSVQMKLDGVLFPAQIRIIKEVFTLPTTFPGPVGTSSPFAFGFTSSANSGLGAFSLVDDDGMPPVNDRVVNSNIQSFYVSGSVATEITVTENDYLPRFQLSSLVCAETAGSVQLPHSNDSTQTATAAELAARTATIRLQEGEFVTCTFTNTEQFSPTAAPASVSGRVLDSFGNGIGGVRLSISDAQTGDTWSTISSPFGYYNIDGPEAGNFYVMTISSKRYSFADDTRTFTLNEDLVGFDWVANP